MRLGAVLWAVYLVFWAGGVVSHMRTGGTPADMSWAAPLFLFLAAGIALASYPEDWRSMLAAAAIGFSFELLGVRFAYPFGQYHYTPILAPLVLGVPLAVAGAWMVLFAYVRQMRAGVLLSALWMTAMDLVIDPLAANDLGYWRWSRPGLYYGVPALNFLGWFAVSALVFLAVRKEAQPRPAILWLGTSILLFFTAIAAVHHFFFPAALGLVLGGLGYWRWRSSRASTMI